MPFDLAVPCVAGVDLAIVCLSPSERVSGSLSLRSKNLLDYVFDFQYFHFFIL